MLNCHGSHCRTSHQNSGGGAAAGGAGGGQRN